MSVPAEGDPGQPEVLLAARRMRLAAFLLDGFIVVVLLAALLLLGELTGVGHRLVLVLVPAVAFVYYVSVAVWLTDGLTVGKAVCNIRVRRVGRTRDDRDVRALGWAIGRHSLGYVVVDVLGAGVLWAFVQRRRRCPHDLAFSSEVVVCWTQSPLIDSPTERLKTFQQQVKTALDDVGERYGWAFFLWRWLTRLIVLPAVTILVVSRSAFAEAATQAAASAPAAAASGATSLSTPAATTLWAATTLTTGLLLGQIVTPDGTDPGESEPNAAPPSTSVLLPGLPSVPETAAPDSTPDADRPNDQVISALGPQAVDAGGCYWWPYTSWYWWCVIPTPENTDPIFMERPCRWFDYEILREIGAGVPDDPALRCSRTDPSKLPNRLPGGEPIPPGSLPDD